MNLHGPAVWKPKPGACCSVLRQGSRRRRSGAGLAPLLSPSPPCLHTLSGGTASRLDRRPEPFLLFLKLGGHRLKIRGFENLANFDLGLAPGKRIRAAP